MRLNEKKRKRKKQIIYSVVIVFLLLALFTPFYSYLYDILEKPFISAYTNNTELKKDSKNLFHTWFSKKKILEENAELERRIAILEVDNLRAQYLETLLERDGSIHTLGNEIISSSIIRKNNDSVITILGGKNREFSADNSIISYDGTLIGRISEVFDLTSRVALFNKNGEISNGILFPQDISIIMTGNGNAMAAELNRDIDVAVGDVVYAQNEPGSIIGRVSNIDFDPRDPVKRVYISPVNSITSLQQIGILKTTIQ